MTSNFSFSWGSKHFCSSFQYNCCCVVVVFLIKNEGSRNMHFYSKVKPFSLNRTAVLQLKVFIAKARLIDFLSFTKFSSCMFYKMLPNCLALLFHLKFLVFFQHRTTMRIQPLEKQHCNNHKWSLDSCSKGLIPLVGFLSYQLYFYDSARLL